MTGMIPCTTPGHGATHHHPGSQAALECGRVTYRAAGVTLAAPTATEVTRTFDSAVDPEDALQAIGQDNEFASEDDAMSALVYLTSHGLRSNELGVGHDPETDSWWIERV